MNLFKIYDFKKVENKTYRFWEKKGFFNPDRLPKRHKKPYTIVLPPPNVTGELHMGHALNAVVQDILIRWKRMAGFKTLWVPGTDHAGIATQNVVEKQLKKEGLTRFDLGREKFLERVWEWKKKYGDIILDQFKKLGSSCDWSRTRFTMDKNYSEAVKETFLQYYKKGWIYQGEKIINWCSRCATSLSDLEVEYENTKSKLWYIRYPLKKQKQHISVATTRPETMLGDTAIAVHPDDKRYKDLIGQSAILPIQNRIIPIIADKGVDPKFGTGAIKVTPGHSFIDFEIGQKHNFEIIKVIGSDGKMTKTAGEDFQGLIVFQARQKIVEELEKKGLIEKVEDCNNHIGHCYRCNTIIEPLVSKQWFLKMKELAKLAEMPVKKGQIKFHPKSFEKPYFSWIKNIKDWCISRQIWWGHKIPLKGEIDVLDTWFSSALWPFAALGWPKKAKDLKVFYSTDVLSTARDILNFWVARMIFSGMEFIKKIPFKDVYIHATILNKEGKRMSKSLGTGINPIDLIEKYGADATRFGITYQIMGGQDIKFAEDNIIMGKKFCNKIWNASRFVLGQTSNLKLKVQNSKPQLKIQNLTVADKKILKALEKTINSVNKSLNNFQFGKATHIIYDFFWHDFCDKYIEESKKQNDEKTKKILLYVLLSSLILLHPFMPFITEEIYQKLPTKKRNKCLMVECWQK